MTDLAAGFFERRREWSKRKHEVFEGYLPQFARILGKAFVVDGFAGRGYYGTSGDLEPGSPILAAEIAKDLAERGSASLECINVESNAREFRDLDANTRPFSSFVTNLKGTFAANVDDVLKRTSGNPALFFLDPFGIKGLEWDTMSKIARREAKTELLINFNAPKFDRDAGWLDSFGQKPRNAFIARLHRVMGSTAWQATWDPDLANEDRYREVVAFYSRQLHNQFGFWTGAYPVRTVGTQQLKYFLVFASRAKLAIRIMSSIFYGVEHRYLEERTAIALPSGDYQLKFEGLIPSPPTVEDLEEDDVQLLKQDILSVGRRVRKIRFDDLQDTLMDRWMGRMVEKHYRRVCRELREHGVVTTKTKGFREDTVLTFKS